ncbi:FAD-dependent oxidoreductase [Vulgatibacter sp.]|uniref:FAD-dependent oxidoreductase n=1 Tax=Vulgatibacter sp. TaxID=1971226 RepID=UPI00356774A4
MSVGLRGRAVEGSIRADVVVIGGGIAGAAAALAARRKGRQVALVRRAWGATALSAGLLDLAPDPFASPAQPLGERRDVRGCIRALALRSPRHPWSLLAERLERLPALLGRAAEESGGRLRFTPLEAENRCVLTPLGTLKTSAGGQDAVLRGDLHHGGRIGVVGFARHPAWDAELLAASLAELATVAGLRCGAAAVPTDYLDRIDDYALRPLQLAARIEKDPDRLVQSIRRALPPGVDRLLLPPLLGTDDPAPVLAHLEAALGLPCAELPAASTAPLPGLRLQRLLEARLEAAGVQLLHGEATSDGDVAGLRVTAPLAPILDPSHFDEGRATAEPPPPPSHRVEAVAVVLATGRYVGGGIRRNGRLRESVFDLPVAIDGGIDPGSWPGSLTSVEKGGEQPAFRAGVAVDRQLRPLDRDGTPRDTRLFACGSVLAGNDPARDGAGLGLSWCTGWLAGEAACGEGG